MIILKSIESIFSIIIMISLGYFFTFKEWFDKKTSKLFSKLVFNVSLPALIISNLLSNFNKDNLFNLSKGLIVPLASMFLCYIIGVIISKIIKVKPNRQGTFQCMFFSSNTIFIGLPVNLALFGNDCIPYVFLYYIANAIFFWTIGIYSIKSDIPSENNEDNSIFNIETLKGILSPPLFSFIFAMILILLNIQLPQFLIDTCKYLGDMTTPLSMFFIGINMHSVNINGIKFNRDMAALLIGRFIISPLTIVLFSLLIPLPKLMKNVFVIQSSMPVMTLTAIIVDKYDLDSNYAAVMTVITTLLSMISIPIYMMILNG